jgi:hypothetical protein
VTINRESLLDKVRALLSKTTDAGCTEAEAMAALTKAQAMIDAYEVTDEELALTKEEKAVMRTMRHRDPHFIRRGLSNGVQKFTNTTAWYSTVRRGEHDRTFCGLPADVEHAEWLLETLTQFVQAQLAEFLMQFVGDGYERRAAMRGFVIGCTDRIGDRLTELATPRPTQSDNSRALVITKRAAIDECMKCAGIKLGSARYSAPARDSGAYNAGREAGNRATFGRPVDAPRSRSLPAH